MRSLLVVGLCLVAPVAHADAVVGWMGALRVGAGGTLDGGPPRPRGVDLGLRLHLLVGRGEPRHTPEDSWSAGPFFDLHTLGAERTDVVGGVHIDTPNIRRRLGVMRLDVGGGYSFANGTNVGAPELVVGLFGGARIDTKAHLMAHVGVYVEMRMFFSDARAVALTAGLEIDPIGILMIVFGAAGSGG